MNNFTEAFIPEKTPVVSELGKMAAKVAYYNFEWRYITLVMFNTLYQITCPLHSFLEYYDKSVILKMGKIVPHVRATIPQFVIFGRDSLEIIDMVKWLDASKHDNAGKYVIVCTSEYEKCDEQQVFEVLYEVNIINIIYFRKNGNDIISFSYEKLLPGKCKNTQPYSTNIQDGCKKDACFKSLFPLKLKNFYKCPLIISTFEQPPFMYINNDTQELSGVDGEMLKFLSDILNATLIIKTPASGSGWGLFEDNNWTGSLGDIYNDKAHASACSMPLTGTRYGNFQVSFVYNYMDMAWTAKLPILMPSWENLLHPFKLHVRFAIFAMFLFIVLLNTFTKTIMWDKIRKTFNIPPPKPNLLFYSWLIFLGMPLMKLPTHRPLLLLICSWIWFCFVIRSGYQAALISSLKQHIYENYFQTFDNVLEAKYPFGGPSNIKEYYASDPNIYKQWKTLDVNSTYETLDKISNGKTDFVLALNKDVIVDHLLHYKGARTLQIVPEKIVTSPTVLFFKRHSPLEASVSKILISAVEAGFTQIWQSRFQNEKEILIHTHSHNESLNIDNFKGLFILLICAWVISILFFIVELCCGKLEGEADRCERWLKTRK